MASRLLLPENHNPVAAVMTMVDRYVYLNEKDFTIPNLMQKLNHEIIDFYYTLPKTEVLRMTIIAACATKLIESAYQLMMGHCEDYVTFETKRQEVFKKLDELSSRQYKFDNKEKFVFIVKAAAAQTISQCGFGFKASTR